MATEWAQAFYGSTHWKKCRHGFIAYKRGLCERCLANGIIKPGTQVHHKVRLTVQNITDPNVALNWDNLELLCDECHEEEHARRGPAPGTARGRFTVGADGKVQVNDKADKLREVNQKEINRGGNDYIVHVLNRKKREERENGEE